MAAGTHRLWPYRRSFVTPTVGQPFTRGSASLLAIQVATAIEIWISHPWRRRPNTVAGRTTVPVDARRYRVRAVERALNLLGQFSVSEPELTLTQLSSRSGLSESTAYRLLATLGRQGYTQRNEQNGAYRLGFKCLDLGTVFLSQLDLSGSVMPVLEALRQQCLETVHLAILDPGSMEIVYVEKLEGLLPIGMMGSRVGARAPAYCTGLGKCMLAHMEGRSVGTFYAAGGLRARTPKTITDIGELFEELRGIGKSGYAIDSGEHELGVRCVAAPVWDHQSEVVAAISVSGPGERIDGLITEQDLVGMVTAAAQEASMRMGYPGRTAEHNEMMAS